MFSKLTSCLIHNLNIPLGLLSKMVCSNRISGSFIQYLMIINFNDIFCIFEMTTKLRGLEFYGSELQ